MKQAFPLVLLASTIALAACQQEVAEPAAPAATAGPATTTAAAPPEGARDVTLTSTGLILVDAVEGRGAATSLDFGMAQASVLAAMGEDFPAPAVSTNAECGAGPMQFARFGALTLNFLAGELAGWRADRADNLVTSDGIRPGIMLEQLQTERPVELANSTLEGEFDYQSPDGGLIGGFTDRQGTVLSLHAGTQCFFR